MDYTNLAANQDIDEHSLIFELGSLYDYLRRVSDTRKPKGKLYSLPILLILMMLAKLGGEDKPSGMADWVTHRMDLLYEMKILSKKKTPSHMTYRRVLQNIVQPGELEEMIRTFHQNRLEEDQQIVFSMDGKTLKGTIPKGETHGTLLLSIYVPGQGLVLVEAEVDRKENEIVVAPKSCSKSI